MRIGIFGGSFNPVHFGHLLLAECCREQARLDEVWFMPAAISPHKLEDETLASAKHRIEMLELAIGGHRAFHLSRLEIDRGGVSYTVDSLSSIALEQPDADLFLLMGADSLYDLPYWRDPKRICELALPLCVARPNHPPLDVSPLAGIIPESRLHQIKACSVTMPLVDLSATDIRNRIATGRSIRYQTPRAVEQYIATHALYQIESREA